MKPAGFIGAGIMVSLTTVQKQNSMKKFQESNL